MNKPIYNKINKFIKEKPGIVFICLAAALIIVLILIQVNYKKEKLEVSPGAAIIPDPVPEPIEQVDCLKGQFRHDVARGETLKFEVRLDDTGATTTRARLAPLPRGVSGTLDVIEPGLGQVELNIGESVEPADYSLNIIIEEGAGDRAERLCQFNLIINYLDPA